jgi:3-isopropylmalate/(R)-2-methylmalate dehydratase small subunit
MEPFNVYKGKAAVMDRMDVDTDQIIPKQFLKRVERSGFGKFLFYDWRFQNDGSKNLDFELNFPENEGAGILIAGRNFGCGSSREHAPWALKDYGFNVIIAPSFADIFYNNCIKNGILPVFLEQSDVYRMMEESKNGSEWSVNLPDQTVSNGKDFKADFQIDSYWKDMLINGWDEIDITLTYGKAIEDYEQKNVRLTADYE